jgi:hypothetical protein
MCPRTQATIDELEQAEWFSRVGEPREGPYKVLNSWQDAIDSCGSPAWQNLCLEAANQYRERLQEKSPSALAKWNELVVALKPVTIPFVRRKISRVVATHSLSHVFEGQVQWDILHVAMESEYSNVYPPGFYASQAFWYVNGRFPCGWEGEFPNGRLVLY